MYRYTCILFLFSAVFSYGQPSYEALTDSLEQINPELLDSIYYNLFIEKRKTDPDGAELFAGRSYQYAKATDDISYMIKSGNALG
jgi:hypothetical protein